LHKGHGYVTQPFRVDRESTMNRRELGKIDTRIKTIKKAAQELKELSAAIPAVDRNTARILASVKMLEINISDVKDLI
jgi:hypothetical protein